MQEYVSATDVIDWRDQRILALAQELRRQATDELSFARAAFEWVRDNVQHSVDFNPLRSDVPRFGGPRGANRLLLREEPTCWPH